MGRFPGKRNRRKKSTHKIHSKFQTRNLELRRQNPYCKDPPLMDERSCVVGQWPSSYRIHMNYKIQVTHVSTSQETAGGDLQRGWGSHNPKSPNMHSYIHLALPTLGKSGVGKGVITKEAFFTIRISRISKTLSRISRIWSDAVFVFHSLGLSRLSKCSRIS